MIRSKWAEFYQELGGAVSTFGFKVEVLIVTARGLLSATTKVEDIIMSYLYITQGMVDSHCEILWTEKSGADLGRQPTSNDEEGLDNPQK